MILKKFKDNQENKSNKYFNLMIKSKMVNFLNLGQIKFKVHLNNYK